MDGIGDFLTLVLDVNENSHVVVVETLAVLIITNFFADFSCDLLVVDSWAIDMGFSKETDLD
jgi:hypothetical protein